MTAIRLARGVTGRDKVIKFAGCHGHVDARCSRLVQVWLPWRCRVLLA